MTSIKVVRIPSDKSKPVEEVEYDQTDYKNLTALIFDGDRDGTFDRYSLPDKQGNEVTFWYDDNGLARLDNEEPADIINLRAMELAGHLMSVDMSRLVPAIGDYIITGGADREGNSLPAPAWVKDHPFEWHLRYGVRTTSR